MDSTFPYLYLPAAYAAERELAALLVRLAKQEVDPIPEWDRFVTGLDKGQTTAVEMAARHSVMLLYGFPGTGKTTTIRRIIQMFDNVGLSGFVGAPSGKAAKRAGEMILGSELNAAPKCSTTYRALEFNPRGGGFSRTFHNPLDYDYAILDEWGFASLKHARDFLMAINPKKTRVILVGDPYQLPSVEAGSVYRDMIQSRKFPACELTEVHRTGANSGIAVNAVRILKGENPVKDDPITGETFKDWKFIRTEGEEETAKKVVEMVCEKLPAFYGVDKVKDIQLISPGKKSAVGTVALNDKLREALNPGKARYRGFRLHDKVINKRNLIRLEICNGDVGIVKEIGEHGLVVNFGPGAGLDGSGIVKLEGEDAAFLQLNYAQTVHSTQGSEMPVALIPLHRCHWRLLSRNLLFTGQTRAKQGAVLIGDVEAMRQCVLHSETDSRTTALNHWLDQYTY